MKNEIHTEAIILNYRKNSLTLKCIQSLIGQVKRIWVVDNSQDQQLQQEFILRAEELFSIQKNIILEILTPGTNLGFSKGIRFALDKCLQNKHLKAILIINNDAIAYDGMVEQMCASLQGYNNNALIAARASENSTTPSMLWYNRYFAVITRNKIPGSFPYLTGACLLVPVHIANPFLFDTDFFMYGEDVELSWRLGRIGIPLVLSEAQFEHLGSESSRVGSAFYEYHVTRGHFLLTQKLAKNRVDHFFLITARVLTLTTRGLLRCIRFRSITPLYALINAFLGNSPPTPSC